MKKVDLYAHTMVPY